jgi:hypothetical protein
MQSIDQFYHDRILSSGTIPPDVMDNDGLLHCKVQEIPQLYPQYASFFDMVLDIGVFGWGGTHQFNTTKELEDDIAAYMHSILFLLKPQGFVDPQG